MKIKLSLFVVFSIIVTGCEKCNLYGAGGGISLHYCSEHKMNSEIVERYIDTLSKSERYHLPKRISNMGRIDSVEKVISFNDYPVECYLVVARSNYVCVNAVSYGGSYDWLNDPKSIKDGEKGRIEKRLGGCLSEIEQMAKRMECRIQYYTIMLDGKWEKQ